MPPQNVGIIYARDSKIFRRIFVPDIEPNATGWLRQCGPGETFTLLPHASDWGYAACVSRIQQVAGVAVIPSGRCAIVDGAGNVVDLTNADPALDTMPGFSLIASDVASVGDHYNVEIANAFSRRYAVVLTSTSTVDAISWQGLTGATPPDGQHFLMNSLTLNIGDTVTLFQP